MFGKRKNKAESSISEEKTRIATENEADQRTHGQSLGDAWTAITGMNPKALIPQVVGTVLHEGGTRPVWQWKNKDQEFLVLAWPKDSPARAAVLVGGPEGGELKPLSAFPLLEGLPNDLTVEKSFPREEGHGGDVAVLMVENKNPMWFFDPMYERDIQDLTPGVTHTFWLSGLALGIRQALLDDITITSGPKFESWATDWLARNPGKKSQDVPPLKLEIQGRHFIMPGRFYGEYQLRSVIEKVEECELEKMPIKILYLSFPFDNRPALNLPLYASKFALKDLEPAEGMEIEAYVWLQGRVIDLETREPAS